MTNSRELLHGSVTASIIGAFYAVYNELGFGFLESVYCAAMEQELIARGHRVSRELGVPVFYAGKVIAHQRLDFVVDEVIVLEIKSSEKLPEVAERQLHSYLKNTQLSVGLLLHFGLTATFKRIVQSKAVQLIRSNPEYPPGRKSSASPALPAVEES